MRDIERFLTNLSQHPGVYQMLDKSGKVLYVGKAKNLKKRVASYFSQRSKDIKTQTLLKYVDDIDITVTHSESEAVLLECNLIKKHSPRFNVLLRDDKSYPYILITIEHPFPRIDLYRGPRKKNALYFGPYPSASSVRETISILQKIFRIRTCRDHYFATRTRPCLLYQLERCTGPCVGLISQEEYAHQIELAILFLDGKSDQVIEELQKKMESAAQTFDYEHAALFRDQINRLRQIQDRQYVHVNQGNADIIGFANQAGVVCVQLLSIRNGQLLGSRAYFPNVPAHSDNDEILFAFLTQHYFSDDSHIESIPQEILLDLELTENDLLTKVLSEQAKHKVELHRPIRGEKRKWVEMATTSAKQSLSTHLFAKTNMEERLRALQEVLEMSQVPQRMECFDISHTMGELTVGSCVVFDQTGPVKSDYRRFNIENVTPGDDIAAMKQLILRRFKRLQKDHGRLPDIVLIDGGKTQLAAAEQMLQELNITSVEVVGVSKGPDRKPGFETIHSRKKNPYHLPPDSQALHLIQQIRDEAHRFAITGHRNRRDKKRSQSTLELIPGIGAKRRRDILRYFGGIQGVAHASLDELAKVPGISRSLAERIFAAFHDTTI